MSMCAHQPVKPGHQIITYHVNVSHSKAWRLHSAGGPQDVFSLCWQTVISDTGHGGITLRGGASQRDMLANRCPGCASGPWAAEPAGTPRTL